MSCRFPLVAFDLDGTLAQGIEFVWSLLHDGFGSDAELRRVARESFFSGKIGYGEWFASDLALLQAVGASRERMLELFAASVWPTPGALEVLAELHRRGCRLAVISGSVDLLLEHLYPAVPFAHVLINRLRFDRSGQLVGGEPTSYDLERKAEGLVRLAEQEGLGLDRCAFLGDQENDIAALRLAGLGIAFNPATPQVASAADVVVRGPDLRPVLDYLT